MLVLLVALGLSVPGLRAQPARSSLARAEAAMLDEMQKAGIPGAAVAVVVGDRVMWTQGFGVASTETKAPVTADTLFQIGSVTKSFTAAALHVAAAQGALVLDRSVGSYVKGLASCVGAPTLAQLLSHTGGLIDEPDEFGTQGEDGLGAYQRTWTSEYCMLPPGRVFSYSNSGYSLAGLALQEVDGKPFADAMKTRVLAPLGMTRTTFRPTEAMTWPLAVGHRRNKDGAFEVVRPLANDARLWPAGTLYSSANEMARFLVALMNDGRVDGTQVLPVGVAQSMRLSRVAVRTTRQLYAQGLFIERGGRLGHGGTMTGYVAQVAFDREPSMGVVVLTNADGVNPEPLASRLREEALRTDAVRDAFAAIQREAARRGPPPPPTANGIPRPDVAGTPAIDQESSLTPGAVAGFVGTYSNPRRFTVQVVSAAGGLILKRFGRDFPMRALQARGEFLVDLPNGGTEKIVFGIGPDGRADYLQMNAWALARVP